MAGHLFMTRGDLRHLACDAILIPSGLQWIDGVARRGHVQAQWRAFTGADRRGFVPEVATTDDWTVLKIHDGRWPAPGVWIGHTGDASHGAEDDAEVLGQFVEHAGRDVRSALAAAPNRPGDRSDRPLGDDRPLLAVPIVGTGRAGREREKGAVIKLTVERLNRAVDEADVDVVLVAFDDAHHSAAQQARSRAVTAPETDAETEHAIDLLATEAQASRLVLFLGAGVSIGAGLPSWSLLLDALIERAGLDAALPRDRRHQLDSRDIATIIKIELERQGLSLPTAIIDSIRSSTAPSPDGQPRVSLLHQLLATLPTTEAITTNYDTLFETAWNDAGRNHDVLPGTSTGRWLLKLHGSIDDADRIVLSREDYLRFEDEGSAMAGLVQAMLLTRHLLFVGYSLSDDNFHRMVHQVRSTATTRSTQQATIGTVLTPTPPSVLNRIWEPAIRFVSTASADEQLNPRRQAIVLDALVARTSPPGAHLLDDSYRAVFHPDELAVSDAITRLRHLAQRSGVRASLRREVESALARFGRAQ